jgi:GAF domain-containing protein
MPASKRRLTVEDVARVLALSSSAADPTQVYRAVDTLARETVGYRLLTVFRPIESTGELERVYSSNPADYPVGGRKRVDTINRDPGLARRGEIFLAATPEEVARTYPDRVLLERLGIGAILNVPIRHAGRWLATLNCAGDANSYGAGEIAAAKVLADLLAPTLLLLSASAE